MFLNTDPRAHDDHGHLGVVGGEHQAAPHPVHIRAGVGAHVAANRELPLLQLGVILTPRLQHLNLGGIWKILCDCLLLVFYF